MILELQNIEKSFGDKKVLCGVSMRAEGGKAFGLWAETARVKPQPSASSWMCSRQMADAS